MEKVTCEYSECKRFECGYYENNGTEYGYCWGCACPEEDVEFRCEEPKGENNE